MYMYMKSSAHHVPYRHLTYLASNVWSQLLDLFLHFPCLSHDNYNIIMYPYMYYRYTCMYTVGHFFNA